MAQMWDAINQSVETTTDKAAEAAMILHHPSDSPVDRPVYQSPSPEGTSLSDKLDKMDTSETSVSSEKTSPLTDGPTTFAEPVDKHQPLTTTKGTADHLKTTPVNQQNQIVDVNDQTTAQNSRTDSSISMSSYHEDLELPSNYLTETVDFPDSPHQMKLMQRSINGFQDEAGEDGQQQEEEEESSWMDQQEDDLFRSVLSPESDETKFKKGSLALAQDELSFNIVSTSTPTVRPTDARYAMAVTSFPYNAIKERSLDAGDMSIIDKISRCYDTNVRIKDLAILYEKLKCRLSVVEINRVLHNGLQFAEYLDENVFEALQLISLESNGQTPPVNQRTKIKVDLESLDNSIVNHFEDEIHMEAIFECNPSAHTAKRTVSRMALHLENAAHEDSVFAHNQSMRTLISLPQALCVESDNCKAPAADCQAELELDDEALMLSCAIQTCDFNPNPSYTAWGLSNLNNISDSKIDSSPERPSSLNPGGKKKRKIKVHPDILNASDENDDKSLSSLSNRSDADILSPSLDDIVTPDDITTPDVLEDSVYSPPEMIPEVTAAEERDDERRWRSCVVSGVQQKIDMKVIEPYKKVLSHGGYNGAKRSAIIVFCACYLPDHGRKDYDYVMDNLFLYVLTTLDQLVAEDYLLIYLHGALERNNMPTFGWLKRCYTLIDRRLRKNLKGLYLVHPTFWLKTIVLMTKPFVSTKFARKLQFVSTLQDLFDLLPVDHMSIPDKVKQLDFQLMIRAKKKKQKSEPKRASVSGENSVKGPDEIWPERCTEVDVDAPYRYSHSEDEQFTGGWL